MGKNPLTSSERRGIIAVAALALFITGGGLILNRCQRPEPVATPEEIEVLLDGDSLNSRVVDDSMKKKRSRRKKEGVDSLGSEKRKSKKIYRRRSPLDEPV